MKLRPIADEIAKRSIRNGFLFATFSIFFTFLTLIFYGYDIYFDRIKKLMNGYIPEISSALSIGDTLFTKKRLSSIEKSLYFHSIFIEEGTDNKIVIYNGEKINFANKVKINSKYSYYIYKGKLYFLTSFSLGEKNLNQPMSLVAVQKINYVFIILTVLFLFSLWWFIFLLVRTQSKKNYEGMFVPIITLSENLKKISSSKEEYNKFVNYTELDLIYKNFNKVYVELELAQEQLKQMEMMRAISSTIQMLAHDLRHPFSHIKNSLQAMLTLTSYEKMREYIKDTGRAIEKDILRVENMLTDLLQFRTEGKPNLAQVSFYKIIYGVIKNCFEVQSKIDVLLYYDFKHRFKVYVDPQKIERVLSNIIINAIEAMSGNGKILFSTQELEENGEPFIEICIANTNSYIDEKCINKVFELFYTNGRKRGSGIGLTVAREIILQHGGRIFCTSSKQSGVKFFIHLPYSTKIAEDNIEKYSFPTEAKYFINQFERQYNLSQTEYEKKSDLIEEKIFNYIKEKNITRKYQIVILEDDETYAKNFLFLVSSELIKNVFNFITFTDYQKAKAAVKEIEPEYIICDIDLGLENLNGFDFVKELRSSGCNSKICIHTNRFLKCDLELSLSVRSDFFIVKPMSRFQFLKFVCSYIFPNEPDVDESFNSLNVPSIAKDDKGVIVVIDDEDIYLNCWEIVVEDAEVKVFSHPDNAYDYFVKNPDAFNKIECIIVDYYFDNTMQNICQMNFVNLMRKINFVKPIFISTNAILNEAERKIFSGVLKKEPYSLSSLKNIFKDEFCLSTI